jgi:hypothetical protein
VPAVRRHGKKNGTGSGLRLRREGDDNYIIFFKLNIFCV